MPDNTDGTTGADIKIVVVNDEEQYSIWFPDRPVPAGWRKVSEPGTEADCLAYIEQVWTDMRPRSLREAMAAGSDG